MLKRHARRLVCRFIILLVLAAVLAATSANPAEQKAAAAIPFPCTYCETMFDNCISNFCTIGDPFACYSQCAIRYNTCVSNCS